MGKVNIGQQGSVRFQGTQPVQTDPSFLNTYARAVSLKERQDAENLSFLTKDFDNKATAERQKAQGALTLAKGVDSLDENNRQKKLLADSYKKLVDKAPENFKPFLQQRADEHMNRYGAFSVPYMSGQVNTVREETDKTFLANSINTGIEMSGFDDYLGTTAVVEVETAAESLARKKYGDSPLLVENAKKVAVSSMFLGAVSVQANGGDMEKAESILSKYSDDMTPDDKVKAAKIVAKAKQDIGTREALDLASFAVSQFPEDYKRQEDIILANAKNDQQYKMMMGFLKDKNRVNEKQKLKNIENTKSKILENYSKGLGIDGGLLQELPYEERVKTVDQLSSGRGKDTVVTDWKTYDRVSDELISMPLSEVQNFKLNAYDYDINPKDMRALEAIRNERMKEVSRDKSAAQRSTLKEADDVIKTMYNEFGLPSFDKQTYGKFRSIGFDEWERLKENPNVKSTNDLRIGLMNAYRKRGITKSTAARWFNPFGAVSPDTPVIGGMFNKETSGISQTLNPQSLLNRVPEEYRLAFRKAYRAKFPNAQPASQAHEDREILRAIEQGKIKLNDE